MKRRLLLVLALTSTALAAPVPSRAWSDARSLPPEASYVAVLPSFAACEPSGFDTSKVSPDALQAYRGMEALVASMKADDPNRATMEHTLAQMRANYANAAPLATPEVPTSLAEALKHAQGWLEQHEAAGWNAFQSSRDAGNAGNASRAALAAAMLGKPNAALAALLTAQRLEPNNPQHLVNLSGVLETLGMPGEALVVLEAAGKLGKGGPGALGWSSTATLNANRGLALSDLRRWKEAETALTAATTAEPRLAEARLGLARVLTCEGKPAQAATVARAGLRRTPPPKTPTGPAGEVAPSSGTPGATASRPAAESHLPAAFTFDLTHGQDVSLPNLRLPRSGADAAALADPYRKLAADLAQRLVAITQRQSDVEARLRARPPASPLVQERRAAIWRAVLSVDDEPEVRTLLSAWQQSDLAVTQVDMDFFHCEGGCILDQLKGNLSACAAALATQNDRWREAMHGNAPNLGALMKARYRLVSALAANYSDGLWHERASLQAEAAAVSSWLGYVELAAAWARDVQTVQSFCVDGGVSGTAEQVAGDLTLKRADPCKAVFDGLSLAYSVSVLSFEISCDTLTLSATSPGWIGAFGQISEKFGRQEYTVTVGIQEGVSVPGTTTGVSSQQGTYVTWGQHGLVDAGVSITTSVKIGVTKGSISGSKDALSDMSGALSGQWSFIASPGGPK
ncbi:hypothetical protein [Deinococcus sonorensis]|uniref:Tetratricopeptide repeat protein n=1 Tax=Deinococcus sonorensis KR-87 TaxID=694439 RepID=A0AAU7UFZ8_9DEIO